MGKKGGTVCAVRGCSSRTTKGNIVLFRFPKDTKRATQWMIACKREDLMDRTPIQLYNNYKVCALHFEKTMIKKKERIRLSPYAMPTIFLKMEKPTGVKQKKHAALEDEYHPDWVPCQYMGHVSQNLIERTTAVDKKERLDKRRKWKKSEMDPNMNIDEVPQQSDDGDESKFMETKMNIDEVPQKSDIGYESKIMETSTQTDFTMADISTMTDYFNSGVKKENVEVKSEKSTFWCNGERIE